MDANNRTANGRCGMIDPYIITTLQLIGCIEIAYMVSKWIEKRERIKYKKNFDIWYKEYMKRYE